MSESLIPVGDKLHIMTRRLFESDLRRHFAGVVTGVAGAFHEVTGYAFVFNPATSNYEKRWELRTRIFSIGEAGLIVSKIPREVAIESLEYRIVEDRLVFTDRRNFTLDISEFGSKIHGQDFGPGREGGNV